MMRTELEGDIGCCSEQLEAHDTSDAHKTVEAYETLTAQSLMTFITWTPPGKPDRAGECVRCQVINRLTDICDDKGMHCIEHWVSIG